MKKRILSMLLLVALLVTGIPVMAVAAADAETEYVTDLSDLYVGADGSKTTNGATLVGLYTAFNGETGAYDLTAGKWHNKMDTTGATDAILRDTVESLSWGTTANGGLTVGIDTNEEYDAVDFNGTGIDFPVKWADEANVFIETSFVANSIPGSTGDVFVKEINEETFRFDILRGVHCVGYNNFANMNRGMLFSAGPRTAYHDSAARSSNLIYAHGITYANNTDMTKFAPAGLTLYMVKTTADDTVSFKIAYNNGSLMNAGNSAGVMGSALSTVVPEGSTTSPYQDMRSTLPLQTSFFSLYNRAVMDAYTVRVYTGGELTTAEKNLNHLIDLLGYYQINIPATITADALASVASAYATTVFATEDDSTKGSANYTDVKTSLQTVVDTVGAPLADFGEVATTDYDSLYVGAANGPAISTEGVSLVGLFTAFANEKTATAADLAAGKWTNKIASDAEDDAILVNGTTTLAWGESQYGNGGISAGLYTEAAYTTAKNKMMIDLNDAWMTNANFTVESAAVAYGWLHSKAVGYSQSFDFFRIDLMRGMYEAALAGAGGIRMNVIWRSTQCDTNYCFGGTHKGRSYGFSTAAGIGTGPGATAGINSVGYTPGGTTMILTKTTAGSGDAATVTYDARYSNRGTESRACSAVYTAENYATAVTARGTADRFSMFNSTAMDVYAIRVYDGLLTAEEEQWNHLIDLLAFYQVEIPESIPADAMANLANVFRKTNLVYHNDRPSGDDGYTAIKNSLKAAMKVYDLADNGAAKTEYDEMYAAQENLVGLFTAFGDDISFDGTVYGKWYNKVEGGADATLYDTAANGSFGTGANGGITISGTYDAYSSLAQNIGIKLDDSYLTANFTVENVAVLHPMLKAGGLANLAGDYESFRFGALTADWFPNPDATDVGAAYILDWQYSRVSAGKDWWQGAREQTAKDAYSANGKTAVGLTMGVTMATGNDGSVTFDLLYNGAKASYLQGGSASGTIDAATYATELTATPKVGWFTLFNGVPADIYAIRVYNKVLNTEEMNWNHLIDLFAFYEIEIPETADNTLLATLASVYAATPFVASEDGTIYKYSEIKADLQNSFTRAITLVVDGEESVYAAPSGSYTLPAAIDGYTLFGWTDGKTSVAPGATVKFSASVTYTALAVEEIVVDANAEATVIQDANENNYAAIRFNAYINKAQFQAMNVQSGAGTMNLLEMGILIVPKAYVDGAVTFTKVALDAWYAAEAGENKINREHTGAYLDLISAVNDAPAFYGETETALILSGGFADFSNATIKYDPDFVAITYFEVDYDKDGETDNVIYGEYDENNVVSVYDTLNAKLGTEGCEEGTAAYSAIKAIVDQMAALKLPTDIDPDAGEETEII